MMSQRDSGVRWRATGGLRNTLTGLFVACAAASVTLAGVLGHRLSVIDAAENGTATVAQARHADDLVNSARVVRLVVVLVTAVVFIV